MSIVSNEDLSINGTGAYAGGKFRKVIINGSGKVNGDVECQTFECSGKGTLNGNLHTETIKISGHGKLNGSVQSTKSIQIDGSGSIEKGATINTMTINGFTKIGGPVKGNAITINGKCTIDGDCEVDRFKSEGNFTIKGLINADHIDIRAFGNCKAQEIGGQSIKIKFRHRGILKFLKKFMAFYVETNLIEGNSIEIEGTHAKVVRGENIVIGPDCEIDLVEYTGTLKNDKGSVVKEIKKL